MKWSHPSALESEGLISEFEEKTGYVFPEDFKAVVREFNGAYPAVNCFYSLHNGRRRERVFDSLLSFNKTDAANIWDMNELEGSDWDKFTNGEIMNYVIFASGPFGDPIAFDKRTNEIVWIDHEEPDFSKAVEKAADSFSGLIRCWSYDTENPLLCYYASFQTVIFRSPAADEIAELERLSGGRMPDSFRRAFTETVLDRVPEVNYTGFAPYGIDRLIVENTSPIGEKLRQLGLFTFLSSDIGDNICFDMNDDSYPVYQLPRRLLNSEGDIEFEADTGSGKQNYRFPFDKENAFRFFPKLASSFDEFVSELLDKAAGAYSVDSIIESFEEGDI